MLFRSVVDHLVRTHGEAIRRSLLLGVPARGDEGRRAEVVRVLLGEPAGRLDREVLAELDRWQRTRAREQLATRPAVHRRRG